MAQETRAQIATYFETGDVPTEAQFLNLFDSVIFFEDDFIDDDTFATATDSNVASAESIKAYVDNEISGLPSAPVDSVNGETGVVILDADDIDDSITTHKFTSASDISKLAGIEANADVTDATNVDAAGAVMESDFNANTILSANSDDTPVALEIAEDRIVGRLAGGNIVDLTPAQILSLLDQEFPLGFAFGDETSDIVVGTNFLTFETPKYPITITGVSVNLKDAPTGNDAVFDVNLNGSTILSTKITVDAGTKNSEDSATPPVLSTTSIPANSIISVDIDAIGSTIAGVGPKFWMYYKKS